MPDIPDYIQVDAIKVPMNWTEGGRVHNWRNYVGECVKEIWDTLSDQQKIHIASDADDLAGNEIWE